MRLSSNIPIIKYPSMALAIMLAYIIVEEYFSYSYYNLV